MTAGPTRRAAVRRTSTPIASDRGRVHRVRDNYLPTIRAASGQNALLPQREPVVAKRWTILVDVLNPVLADRSMPIAELSLMPFVKVIALALSLVTLVPP